jgi:micrococcal nuclease
VQALVIRVIDGDTIEIEGALKVRYIGIDTPETVHPSKPVECYGQAASNRNKELVQGKVVELERDVSETDKYGRLLRYVYVDGQMVNELLVREGYAEVSTYPPDVRYVDLLLAAQQEAQAADRGLWGVCVAQPTPLEEAPPAQGGDFSLPPCAATDCDCKDFTSHAHAQWFYENYDHGNHHRLDGDNDGIACESLP